MIQSMTGYGKADAEFQGKKIHVEIKSLNSKALDLTTRVAQLYREKEMEMRAMIQSSLERGKVEFSLWVEKGETVTAASINGNIVAAYAQQIKEISDKLGWNFPADPWSVIVRLPEITQSNAVETLSEEEWGVVRQAVQEAIDHLVAFRKQEGVALAAKFAEKLDNIAALMEQIVPFEQSRVAKIRERLETRLEELKGVDYDKNRLEQELIYYIEKLDISEEKQRLANHLNYFRETMQNGHGQGKKLGFIAQEMGREINTTGSKSNQAEMQNIVVKMKDELEQIKEQVLNVM
ncbi:MAG: YicC/YloC family endoribonuclease [Bacteroidales bacterium]|nr:YicC family protein [Bacteroidales bacterium]MDY5453048.1 YicC/YloC family endoribonuclease [Alloprevotella sp.]